MQCCRDFFGVALRAELGDGNFLHLLQKAQQQAGVVRRVFVQRFEGVAQSGRITVGEQLQYMQQLRFGDGAEQGRDVAGADVSLSVGKCLVEQAEAVAHAARCGVGQQVQGVRFVFGVFGLQDVGEVLADLPLAHVFQVELQAAREDGRRQFLRVGGGEDEFDVRRRFFQCFQQRVEAAGGEHVYFVNEIDFVLSFDRCVGDVVKQFACFFDAGARGGIDFDEVGEAALVNFFAVVAFAAGVGADVVFLAVERFGEDAGDGGFADAACAGKEVSVVDAVMVQRVGQRLGHMRLADQFVKVFRPPFACENLIHGVLF